MAIVTPTSSSPGESPRFASEKTNEALALEMSKALSNSIFQAGENEVDNDDWKLDNNPLPSETVKRYQDLFVSKVSHYSGVIVSNLSIFS